MKKVRELPAFRRLLVAAVLNELALSVAAVALALLVYRRTGSALGAAAFFLCVQVGPALLSPFTVARLDQRDVRRVLAALYAAEGLIFVVLAWLVGRFALAPVLALALFDGVLGGTARVLARAAWASNAATAGLMREASAVMNASVSVCYLVGPALGGVIVAVGGTRAALLANAGAFALITVVIATAHGLPVAVRDRSPAAGRLRGAIAIARGEPLIRRLLSLQAAGLVFFTMSIPIEVVFAEHTLHAGAKGYGVLLSAWGAGAIVGSGVYARWRALASRSMITLGSCLLALGFAVMVLAHSLPVAAAGAATSGIGNATELVAMRTTLQESVTDRWMALIVSLSESIIQAAPGVGILLGGAVTALAGPRAAFAVAASGSLLVGCAFWVRLTFGATRSRSEAASHVANPDEHLTAAAPRP
jgi:predicted MFS family arabinose efflux permease